MKIVLAGCRFSFFAVLLSGVFAQTVDAQEMSGYLAPATGFTGLGSGPMAVSLLGSARMIAPLRGVAPDIAVRQGDIVIMATDELPAAVPARQPILGDRTRPAEVDQDIAFAR